MLHVFVVCSTVITEPEAYRMQRLHNPCAHVAISNEERVFFIAFGERMAALRKQYADLTRRAQKRRIAARTGTAINAN